MKPVGGYNKQFVVRPPCKEFSMDELWTIFRALKGVKFSGTWSLAWFGCRTGELAALTLADINNEPDMSLPLTLAKEMAPSECVKFTETMMGARTRALFMDEFTKQHLENFIKSGRGCKFLQTACAKLRDKVGVSFTPRWFRSTFFIKMQRTLKASGVPMVKIDLLVKAMMGHVLGSDITGIYTYFGKDIKNVMTNLHFLKPIEGKTQNKFNELGDRAIPGQMDGLTDEREKVEG